MGECRQCFFEVWKKNGSKEWYIQRTFYFDSAVVAVNEVLLAPVIVVVFVVRVMLGAVTGVTGVTRVTG